MDKTSAEAVIDVEAPEVLAVRRSAVLWSGAEPRVYVERETGVYEQCVVKLGRVGDVDWEVVKGLDEGDHVVSSGNMLIDGQAQLNNLGSPAKP
jgi:Cu(I)/Ag(I) efflux system membrane fusion protein